MATERRFEPWPVALVALLASGMAVSLAFLWIAERQTPDRLIVDSDQALLDHNREALAEQRAAERGWDIALVAQRADGGAWVEVATTSAGDPWPADVAVSLRRERPERTGLDEPIPLEREGERWRAHVPLPLPGRWRLVARAGNDDAFVEREFALELTP